MTPQDHNKVIGIMHLIYGGFFTLMSLLMLVFFGFFASILGSMPEEPNAPPMAFIWAIFGFIFVIYAILSVPGLVAGYAMLKKKSWARIAGIVASVLAAVSFPFGTALCVYSLWFFFSEAGKAYEGGHAGGEWRGSLTQGSPYGWDAQQTGAQAPQHDYQQPRQPPPSWRE